MTQLQEGEFTFARACPLNLDRLVAHVVETRRWLLALRREADAIRAAHRAGDATPMMMQHYCCIRVVLGLHEPARRLPRLPACTEDVLRRRSDLIAETMLGDLDGDPYLLS
jgi:hypothetical protein